jgi:hypothetical protein
LNASRLLPPQERNLAPTTVDMAGVVGLLLVLLAE